ncbi:tetratricopeptide repeat protein [Pseudomonas lalucatii]|uniref:Tetratricopeptide repeat protein n=1 Tax=Pseudomonas lalucatii TaxID=1424203 RepID=A0ABS5PZ59_9PSED|nr:tetratricopeptide repeat protein [Pseudomonas lalucatii]MBS7661781.1 tetratricopeptide repeat protein [Pseudomonas lalucatii]MBS7690646.1 tetratricopeptide repeat protein [Pseudomonas lalucatii]MBS7726286.1 tetratricopeptide repeat protein [Pseudomonas lalucatii]QVM88140.1 tetratricopeptide repeat protein [Pseudomonas lalucatii]
MRTLLILSLALSAAGCTRWSLDHHLNSAYRAYAQGECERVMLELSQAERKSRARGYLQPEISLLRGQCLERQNLFVDAAQTYQFIVSQYPRSEYGFRAKARLETLRQLGHYDRPEAATAAPAGL